MPLPLIPALLIALRASVPAVVRVATGSGRLAARTASRPTVQFTAGATVGATTNDSHNSGVGLALALLGHYIPSLKWLGFIGLGHAAGSFLMDVLKEFGAERRGGDFLTAQEAEAARRALRIPAGALDGLVPLKDRPTLEGLVREVGGVGIFINLSGSSASLCLWTPGTGDEVATFLERYAFGTTLLITRLADGSVRSVPVAPVGTPA